ETTTSAKRALFKKYFHGPNTLGFDVGQIVADVVRFVRERLELVPEARLNMVGHSRGGLIAILAARELKVPVHFMGLYDAVDRHVGPSGTTIPGNVEIVYHAVRSPVTKSRVGFGNCGQDYEAGVKYYQKEFVATHGSIGGDPEGAQDAEAKD